MTKELIIIFLLSSSLCTGQKGLTGLFGKCDKHYGGYMCQQVLFKDNKTFTFYDLLHLRGWSLSEGTWEMKDDTVILNSNKPSYSIGYKGSSTSDSITIYVSDSIEPLPFANLTLNAQIFSTDFSGAIRYPRQLIDTLFISFIATYSGPIIIEKEKLNNIDTLEICMRVGFFGEYFFFNEKWLLKNKKLFHTQDSSGIFDREKYFVKSKLKDLNYKNDN